MNQISQTRDTTTPATAEQIGQALELLSTSLPYRDAGDGRLRMQAYMATLQGATRYGLNIATQAALRGEHGSRFFPSSAELRGLYDAAMRPVLEQRKAEARAYEAQQERDVYQRSINAPRASVDEITARIRADNRIAERVLDGTPVGRRMARAMAMIEDREIIAHGVTLEDFKRGALQSEWGEHAVYSPLLQVVYR